MFNGKAIYNPSGKAGEYAKWACNLYVGCSNDCTYCYCKKGALGTVMGKPKATLKSCFKDEKHAMAVFAKELQKKADAIRKDGGLFFSFSTDPCLPETIELTMLCTMLATGFDVPCSILTKCTDWLDDEDVFNSLMMIKRKVAIGFTLTGLDSLESGPTVASNEKRIEALKRVHEAGFKTFVSVEPVIELRRSLAMIMDSVEACDFYKIGLLSGDKNYDWDEMAHFVSDVDAIVAKHNIPVYWKKSVTDFFGSEPFGRTKVDKDYNLFNTQK